MRRCRWLWVACIIAVLSPASPPGQVGAATLTVTNTADSGPGSLRQAISDAAPGDTITFALSVRGTITLASTLTLTKNVTIQGPGADALAIDGGCTGCEAGQANPNGGVRVLAVNAGVTATVRGLTMQHGFTGPVDPDGGGILNGGALTVADSTISGNFADVGAGVANFGTMTLSNTTVRVNNTGTRGGNGWGGGVFNGRLLFVTNSRFYGNAAQIGGALCQFESGGRGGISVAGSVLSGNYADSDGGAIYSDGPVSIDHTTISGNFITTADGLGGGIYITNGIGTSAPLSLTNSTLTNNRAPTGAGLAAFTDAATLINDAFSGNIATGDGGGITNGFHLTVTASTVTANRAPSGAGINNHGGTLTLTNSTLTTNIASTAGGGINNVPTTTTFTLQAPGVATITDSTLSGNTAPSGGDLVTGYASTTTLARTILTAPPGAHAGTCLTDPMGTLTDNGNDLQFGDPTPQCGSNPSDVTGRDPLLGPLMDNGGPTPTMALLPGSPAIDAGGGGCPATDQRGFPRPQGAACDIGAYEFAPGTVIATTTTLTASPMTARVGQPVLLTATVTPAASIGMPGGTVAFFDGATALGTGTLTPSGGVNGVALLAVALGTGGGHGLTARYVPGSGAPFGGSTSAVVTVTVQPPLVVGIGVVPLSPGREATPAPGGSPPAPIPTGR